jgi:hypothetical protein
MAIEKNITPGSQMELKRWSCTTTATVVSKQKADPVTDFCLCHYECDYKELAFVGADTSDSYENDYRKFLISPQDAGASYEFLLINPDGSESTIDETLGEVFNQGFNTEQPLQAGVNVLWWKVAQEKGYGNYKVKINVTQFGNTITTETHTFVVAPFSSERANETVKIEVINKGVTMNGVNWDGLGEFINMVRVNGKLNEGDLEIEEETIVTTQRVEIDYQKSTRKTYILKIDSIPSSIGDVILDEGALMGWIVTDYNVFNYKDYRDIEVKVDSVSTPDIQGYSKRFPEIGLKSTKFKINRKFV